MILTEEQKLGILKHNKNKIADLIRLTKIRIESAGNDKNRKYKIDIFKERKILIELKKEYGHYIRRIQIRNTSFRRRASGSLSM